MPPQGNPGLSPEILAAMQRRSQGTPAPQLQQQSPGAPGAPDMAPPIPPSQLNAASAPPQSPQQPPQQPEFAPQTQSDMIVMALAEQLKNNNKAEKQQAQMAAPAPSAQPMPQGGGMGGNGMSMGNRVTNTSTSRLLGDTYNMSQPMSRMDMQSDYPYSRRYM